jgi:DNA repair protein RadC
LSNLQDELSPYHALRGMDQTSDEVILSVILGLPTLEVAILLADVGGLEGLQRMDDSRLYALKGVGPAKCARLRAAFELGVRMAQAGPAKRLARMASTDDVAQYFRPRLQHLPYEELHVVLMDCRNRAMRTQCVARGGLVGLSVHPREILAPAIREAAAGIIMCHNHPSGDPTPSMADRELTHRVRQAGEIVGVPLLDHVVVASGGALSV